MPRRWTKSEEILRWKELNKLYVTDNRSIGEIAKILNLSQSTIYDRLLRLNIKPDRSRKTRFNNKRADILIPKENTEELSEFIGILLGDGCLNPTQVTVTLGNKEESYVQYVVKLINKLFGIEPKVFRTRKGYCVVYFGSTAVVRWLLSMGLAYNKVKSQVDLPHWIFTSRDYMNGFLKGFFDTDGSIYKLRFGIQLTFTNRSLPLLESARRCLALLDYKPSKISHFHIYLTRQENLLRFFKLVNPANAKHQKRYKKFYKRR